MKKIILGLSVIVMGLYSCNQNAKNENTEELTLNGPIKINLDSSSVTWKGDMLNMYSHEGTVNLKSADIVTENGQIKSGNFVVDLSSINPTDNGYDEEHTKEKLVQHLSSDDFFNTEKFPTATFNIKSATASEITGDLTIRDKTNEEKIKNVSIAKVNGKTVISGEVTFDRSKYDVKFTAPGDKVLSNDITIKVNLISAE